MAATWDRIGPVSLNVPPLVFRFPGHSRHTLSQASSMALYAGASVRVRSRRQIRLYALKSPMTPVSENVFYQPLHRTVNMGWQEVIVYASAAGKHVPDIVSAL